MSRGNTRNHFAADDPQAAACFSPLSSQIDSLSPQILFHSLKSFINFSFHGGGGGSSSEYIAMSSSAASKKSSSNISISRKSALSSCWIRRICPSLDFTPPPSHVTPSAPLHLKSCFPLPKPPPCVPHHHHHHHQVVGSSEIVTGFGPFQVRHRKNPPPPAAEFPSSFPRRRLATGVLNSNNGDEDEAEQGESRFPVNLRPAHEFVGQSQSQSPHVDFQVAATSSSSFAARQGRASRVKDRDDDHPVANARRNLYNPHAFGLNTVRNLSERQSHCLSSEPEEPFSYWNMGRLGRRNFVSSASPATSSTIPVSRKRAANTYGFFPSKFRRFCRED